MSDRSTSRAVRRSRRKVGFPILLVLIGVHLLMFNLGFTSWHPLLAAFTLWPLLLVAIGLDLVLARTSRWVAAIVSLAVLGGLTLATARLHDQRWSRTPDREVRAEVQVPLEGADSARLVVEMRGGELRVTPADDQGPDQGPAQGDALTTAADATSTPEQISHAENGEGTRNAEGSEPTEEPGAETAAAPPGPAGPLLADGALYGGSRTRFSTRSQRNGQALKARITARGSRGTHMIVIPDVLSGSSDLLRLALTRSVPIDMGIDAEGAGLGLDLRGLQLHQLEVDLEAGEARLLLPVPDHETSLLLDAGLATVDLVLPDDVPARLKVRSDLSSIRIDTDRFPRNGRVYESPGYEAAQERWLITIDAELSFVRVR
jgi:hypothetical protein